MSLSRRLLFEAVIVPITIFLPELRSAGGHRILDPVMDWVLPAGLSLLLAIGVLGYRLLKSSLTEESDLQGTILYIIGVSLVALPLALYWANFLGVPIDPSGVLVALSLVLTVEIGIQVTILWRRHLANHSRVH